MRETVQQITLKMIEKDPKIELKPTPNSSYNKYFLYFCFIISVTYGITMTE